MTAVKIPGYTLKKKLGQGGMAAVFLAEQESFQREVALKVMFPQIAKEPGFAERFLQEARTVARLTHPHIIVVHDVGVANGLHYFAMEYHTGGDLTHRIRNGGITAYQALTITSQIADALALAHEHQIIHRDIKPDNILFRAHNDAAILTDFGIAKSLDNNMQLTQLGSAVGTPKYMSPEQARGQKVDGRTDIYSLGVMLFEMLTGRAPFQADEALALGIKHCQDPIPRLPSELSRYQPLIDRMLAKEPKDRHADAHSLIADIEALQKPGGRPAVKGPASPPAPAGQASTAATVISAVIPAGAGGSTASAPAASAANGYAPFFQTEEVLTGNFLNKRSQLKASFSCEDYEEFKKQLSALQDELKKWLDTRGKKAKALHISIQAHPWIHGRIREVLNKSRSENSPLSAVLAQAEVILNIHDEMNPKGVTTMMSDKDGKPAPAPITEGEEP
ncbi:MAG: serine/threonine-protein kinase [Moraxellaceae bacterium]|nr:serine/threonine-protein kinase [Moraxellaceae bacterium]